MYQKGKHLPSDANVLRGEVRIVKFHLTSDNDTCSNFLQEKHSLELLLITKTSNLNKL